MPEADIDHIYDYSPEYLAEILKSVKTIAMIGASPDRTKFSLRRSQGPPRVRL